MATVTYDQVAQLAYNAGFRGSDVATAVAVAKGESGFNTVATNNNSNGSWDAGLWQINSIHGYDKGYLFNATNNAEAAYKVFQGAGNKWTPWVVFNTGKHLPYKLQAVAAANKIKGVEGVVIEANADGSLDPAFDGTAASAEPDGVTLSSIADALQTIVDVIKNPKFWMGILYVTVGAVLIIMSFLSMTEADNKAAKTAASLLVTRKVGLRL